MRRYRRQLRGPAVGWLRWCRQVTRTRHWRSSFWEKDSCWRKWGRSRRRRPKKQERGLVWGTRFRQELIKATCEVHALAKGKGQVVTEKKTNERVTSAGMIGTCTCCSHCSFELGGVLGGAARYLSCARVCSPTYINAQTGGDSLAAEGARKACCEVVAIA